MEETSKAPFKIWQCRTCGHMYEEEFGAPEEGIAPGTTWADVTEDWICPSCGTPKSDFDMIELD